MKFTAIALKEAANAKIHANIPGVYILRINGKVMKVGSAEIGIQKRMQQYYTLNPACGLNKHITVENRDLITVDFQTCLKSECAELESRLFDKYGPIERMPWSLRRRLCKSNTTTLLI